MSDSENKSSSNNEDWTEHAGDGFEVEQRFLETYDTKNLAKAAELADIAKELDEFEWRDRVGEAMTINAKLLEDDFCTDELKAEVQERIDSVVKEKGKEISYSDISAINDGIKIAKLSGDPKYFSMYYDYYTELRKSPNDGFGQISETSGEHLVKKSGIFHNYCIIHGIDDETIKGFKESLIPMIDTGEEELKPLFYRSNSWGTKPGDYGISDFIVKSAITRVTPRNVRDVMQVNRLIPTGDYRKYEQNRRDAIALQGTLWEDRSFIHDERPGINHLFKAMIKMYDDKQSGNEEEYEKSRENLEAVIQNSRDNYEMYLWQGFDGKLALDLDNYDKVITQEVEAGTTFAEKYNARAIDILRRLEKNTELSLFERPKTGDAELDELIEGIRITPNEKRDIFDVSLRQAGELAEKVNKILSHNWGRIGLKPSMVQALSFTERVTTYALRGIDHDEYCELPFKERFKFKEIVKFAEMTSSQNSFSDMEFEQFWANFLAKFDEHWSLDGKPNYTPLMMHMTGNVSGIAKAYLDEGKPSYMIDSLWSGNLVHELIGLIDQR